MKDNSENRTADCLLEVPEAAAMLVLEPATLSEEPPLPIRLPTLEQVEAASLDVLPTLLGTLETIKTKALVRLICTSQTAPNPEGDADRYLTVPEVAQRLALTDQYVYEAIRTGDLPAIEIGPKKYKRVALTDLRAWAASKRLDPVDADEVQRLRKRLGVTQRELADLVGVAPNSVARWERGELGVRESAARLMRLLVKQAAKRRPGKRST